MGDSGEENSYRLDIAAKRGLGMTELASNTAAATIQSSYYVIIVNIVFSTASRVFIDDAGFGLYWWSEERKEVREVLVMNLRLANT